MRKLNKLIHQNKHVESIVDLESLAAAKAELRKIMIRKRKALGCDTRNEKSLTIAKLLFELQEFKQSKAVLCFLSTPYEVQTNMIISKSFSLGKEVFVPMNNVLGDLQITRIRSLDIEFVLIK